MNAASWLEGLPAPEKWRTLLLAHGPRIATWTLAVLLAVQAAVIVTAVPSATRGPGTGKPLPPSASSRHFVNIASITSANLFGVAPVVAQVQKDGDARPTTMQLVLTGIIAADDPQTGLAILGQTPANAKVFAVGDTVPGQAKLHAVYTDKVIIDRGGVLETLALPKQVAPGAPPPRMALATEEPVADRMRKLITEQPSLLTDVMRPQPVFANGKQTGYRVYPGRNRAAFGKLGLKPGDLVTAINGTSLDDPDHGQEIFRTLGSSAEAHVTVTRNGQQQDLTLNLAQVTSDAESIANTPPGTGDQGQSAGPPAGGPPGTGPAPGADAPKQDNTQQ
jgi:general secretion pathway protein C